MRAAGRAAAIDVFELRVLFQAVGSLQGRCPPPVGCNERKRPVPGLCRAGPKRCAASVPRRTGRAVRPARSDQSDGVGNGQAGAAAGAAAGKNLAAVLGGHAGTEAMHLRALALLGLISSDGRGHKYTLLMIKGFFVSLNKE